jgi:hypothetical protein
MITTKDFGLAALLAANSCRIVNYTTDNLNQMWFEFEDTEKSRELEADFHRATVTCNVQAYLGAQKMLKALIYENRKFIYEHKIERINYSTTR